MKRIVPLRLFLRGRGGNVALLSGFLIPIIAFAMGMAIDYTSAASRRTKLNAIADSAVLAAITPTMMKQSTTLAAQAARNFFDAQAASIPGVVYAPANLVVNVSDSGLTRTATVQYTATSPNNFGKILGKSNTTLGGTSSSTGKVAPNIDYYLLLDTSPSMALPSTQAGIDWMVNATPKQGGCAFACHQTCPSCDNLGNPGGVDNYTLARNNNIVLRIDRLQQAVSNLMTSATNMSAVNNATYRMGLYTFDYMFRVNTALTANLALAQTNSATIQLLTTYKNGWRTSTVNDNDTSTNYDAAMQGINSTMVAPGTGSNASGDAPQEVMIFVTDGVQDQMMSNGSRKQSLMDNGWCTTIKNRGIRIAVLYTPYLPLPTNSWYNTYIAPFQPQISPTMQSCATSGLFFAVSSGDDISAAMQELFRRSVATAVLSN